MTTFYRTKYVNILEELFDDMFLVSQLPPADAKLFRDFLVNWYGSSLLDADVEYANIKDLLYSFNDKNLYSVVAASSAEDGYLFGLYRYDDFFPYTHYKQFIDTWKEANPDLSGAELGARIQELAHLHRMVKEALGSSHRATRKSDTSTRRPKPEMPSWDELQRFYECGRKRTYNTLAEAEAAATKDISPYECNFCGLYHNGHTPDGSVVSEKLRHSRWETAYRRYHNI